MVSWIGDQLASIEDQLDPAHRTAKPTAHGAFPSCSITNQVNAPTHTPTPTREGRPSAETAAQPVNFVRSSDLPAAAAALTIRDSDLRPLPAEQENRESVLPDAAADLPSASPANPAAAAATVELCDCDAAPFTHNRTADCPPPAAAAEASAIPHPLTAESADAADDRADDAAARSPLNAPSSALLTAAAASAVRLTVESAA